MLYRLSIVRFQAKSRVILHFCIVCWRAVTELTFSRGFPPLETDYNFPKQ